MRESRLIFLLPVVLAAMAVTGIAIAAAMLQGEQIHIPMAALLVILAGTAVDLACGFLLRRRGRRTRMPLSWVVLQIGWMVAVLLLGAAILLALPFGTGATPLLIHAGMLATVYFAVTSIAANALFRLVSLFRPAATAG